MTSESNTCVRCSGLLAYESYHAAECDETLQWGVYCLNCGARYWPGYVPPPYVKRRKVQWGKYGTIRKAN